MGKTLEDDLKKELSFDLYGRYAVMRDIINRNREKDQLFRVLDVGGRGNLMKKFLPQDDVFYLDPYVDTEDKNYIEGDGCKMPLENDSFDWVVSADVFEHIPEEKRDDFLSENIRVAKQGVILAAPFHSKEVEKAERIANENYKIISGGKDHVWLKEHIENGLPSEKKLEEMVSSKGYSFQKIHNNRLFLWEILINAMLLISENHSESNSKEIEEFNYYYNKEIFSFDNQNPSYRKIYFIKKKGSLKNLDSENKNIDSDVFLEIIGKGLSIVNKINQEKKEIIKEQNREIEEKREELVRIKRKINAIIKNLKIIKSSKFWKIRNNYIYLKKLIKFKNH